MDKLKYGSLYQRKDGMWVGSVDMGLNEQGKRYRKTVSSKDRATAQAKLDAITTERKPAKTRAQYLAESRLLGTHTPEEWDAKARTQKTCRYCDTSLNIFNEVKDHMIALEVGGSDSIDNVQRICWECNMEKRTTPHDEFTYKGPKPRPFSVLPIRRADYQRGLDARARLTDAKGPTDE